MKVYAYNLKYNELILHVSSIYTMKTSHLLADIS